MTPQDLIAAFETLADAPDGVTRLRELVLQLAVRGKLVRQNPDDEPAAATLASIADQLAERRRSSGTRTPKAVPHVDPAELDFELPRGWAAVRVGEIADFEYGKGLKASDRVESGVVPVYGSNGVVGQHDECLVREAAVVVGRKGSAGALNISTGPSWPTDVTYFVRVPREVELRYWFITLQTLRLDELAGGIKPGLNRNDAHALMAALPPLAEQHRIVARVDELMGLLDRLEAARDARGATRVALRDAALAELRDADDAEAVQVAWTRIAEHMDDLFTHPDDVAPLRQTILQLAVRGRLVPQDPDDEPASTLLERIAAEKARLVKEKKIRKPKKLPPIEPDEVPFEVPEGWEWCRLETLTSDITSGSRGWNKFYATEGATFIRSQDIKYDRLQYDNRTYVNVPAGSEGTRTRVAVGDLVITITGANVGKCALLSDPPSEGYVSQHVALIRPVEPRIGRYLHAWLTGEFAGRGLLLDGSYGAKPGLNLTQLRELPVPIPSAAEQNRLADRFDQLNGQCNALEATLSTATDVRGRFAAAAAHHLDA